MKKTLRGVSEVDPFRVEELVNSLIDNAVKFTENGFVKVFRTKKTGDFVTLTLSVKDSGEGVSKEDLKKIFKPF